MKMIIAVIGGSRCSPEEAQVAEAVGRELAQRGAALICGGLEGVIWRLPVGVLPHRVV